MIAPKGRAPLGHEGGHPDPGRIAGGPDLRGERGRAFGEAGAGGQPVTDRGLVAIVDDEEVQRKPQLVQAGQNAADLLRAHPGVVVVPAQPGRPSPGGHGGNPAGPGEVIVEGRQIRALSGEEAEEPVSLPLLQAAATAVLPRPPGPLRPVHLHEGEPRTLVGGAEEEGMARPSQVGKPPAMKAAGSMDTFAYRLSVRPQEPGQGGEGPLAGMGKEFFCP